MCNISRKIWDHFQGPKGSFLMVTRWYMWFQVSLGPIYTRKTLKRAPETLKISLEPSVGLVPLVSHSAMPLWPGHCPQWSVPGPALRRASISSTWWPWPCPPVPAWSAARQCRAGGSRPRSPGTRGTSSRCSCWQSGHRQHWHVLEIYTLQCCHELFNLFSR